MSKYSLSEFFEEKKEIRELFFEFMKEQFTKFIETLSTEERDAYCEKTGDSKNGFYKRKFETMFGKVIDGTFLKLHRDIVFKEVVYTVMGISEEGHKEILDFRLMGGRGEIQAF